MPLKCRWLPITWAALNKALYNYMHGIGLDADVRNWFEGQRVPKTRVARHFIARALG